MKTTITKKTAALFVSKDNPSQQGIHYDSEHKTLVATNGHILVVIPVEDGLTDSCTIPLGALPAKAGDSSDIQLIDGKIIVKRMDKKGEDLGTITFDPITEQFPPWHKLFAACNPEHRGLTSPIALNPKDLVAFSLLAKNLGLNDEYVTLTFHGSKGMCWVDLGPRNDGDNVYGMVAPFTKYY